MSNGRYVLDEHGNPRPEPDLFKWAERFQQCEKHVAHTTVGDVHVSTIFLGLDHRFGVGAPLLWETMTFNSKGESLDCYRCAGNREQAESQHAQVVAKLKETEATP